MRYVLGVLLMLAAAGPAAAATTLQFQQASLLQFDELYYPLLPGTITIANGVFSTEAGVGLTNCRRASGLAQTASAVQFRYGAAGAEVVYLDETSQNGTPAPAQLRYFAGVSVLKFQSRTGDVVCDGSVVPTGGLESIFANGFE